MKTLGIDLGTNSLGWAILDEQTVLKAGVLVFEEGVSIKQRDSLETPAAVRRAKRMARRLRFRRQLRRRLILEILIENNMCPLTAEELKLWSQKGTFPKDNAEFVAWLKSTDTRNPYCDRARAATEKVDPLTLGRAIYHLAQRRGFKSNRKDQPEEGDTGTSERAKELGVVYGDIARISAELAKTDLTLGQFFYNEIKAGRKVRRRRTGRDQHYRKEWERIAAVQNLDKTLADKIARTLFWQRPLREQSFLVGKCSLEPTRKRAQIGHPEFEEFRALSFVNNIRVIDGETRNPLTPEQRSVAADCFISAKPFDFKMIRQRLGERCRDLRGAKFNFEDTVSLTPSKVTASLEKILPGIDGSERQKAFDALTFFDDNEKLTVWAQKNFGLSQEAADKFVKIRIPEGRAAYSLYAIRKINRFLRKGIELSEAICLAKLPDVIPGFDAKEDEIIAKVHEHHELYRENKRVAYRDTRTENRIGVVPLEKRLGSWLQDEYGIDAKKANLYFRDPKADASYASLTKEEKTGVERGILPKVNLGMIRNPIVQRSMTMLRKLVNELRKKGDIDADTRIHIELARDVNTHNDRMAIQEWQKQNEKKRANARAELQKYTSNITEELVLKYILAEEQKRICLYTGRVINIEELIEGGVDIEHTIPRSRSGDDSQANKTLCDAAFNRDIKKGQMPFELPNHDEILTYIRPWLDTIEELKKLRGKQSKAVKSVPKDNPEARARARQRLLVTKLNLKYWEDKYHRFTKRPDEITPSFINRQLVDTGIMTRHAVALLKTVYRDVYPVNGQAVAFARKLWKVQGEDAVKDRTDHRHHAKDAMVIAALSRDRFHKICTELKADDERKNPKVAVEPPFAGFAQTVFETTQGILVKHVTRHNELKQTKRKSIRLSSPKKTRIGTITRAPTGGDTVRGQLHKDTFYGKIRKPGETETVCVVRKDLNSSNFPDEKALKKIIDSAVCKAITDEIARRGGEFKKAMDAAVAEGTFKLPGERGAIIKKVRVEATTVKNPQFVRARTVTPSKHDYKNAYWAESGTDSYFRLAVYKQPNEKPVSKACEFIAENLLKHVKGIIRPPADGNVRIGYIRPGAMAIVRGTEKTDALLLYKVVAFDNMETERRIMLRLHTEARGSVELSEALGEAGKNKKGESSIDRERPHLLLRLQIGYAWDSLLFEGIHFKMDLNGDITYRPDASE